jgi:CBS domain-containing protein
MECRRAVPLCLFNLRSCFSESDHSLKLTLRFARLTKQMGYGRKAMTTCAEIMTKNPECHLPSAAIDLVARTMAEKDIGPIPIVEDMGSRKLLGIVTDRDITIKAVAKDLDSRRTQARDIMTPKPVTCRPEDDIEDAIKVMEKCQIRRIPVVDDESRLVGIIAQADIATRLKDGAQTAEVVECISKEGHSSGESCSAGH